MAQGIAIEVFTCTLPMGALLLCLHFFYRAVSRCFCLQKRELYATIASLEKDIGSLKREIRERDETIGDKERRIYDLKKKNQVCICQCVTAFTAH